MKDFPVCLRLEGHRVLVVGGGAVAEGKIRSLVAAGAVIRVIAPEVTGSITALAAAGMLELLQRPFQAGDVAGHRLVFTATDDRSVTQAAALEAKQANVFLNAADEPDFCDFTLPSVGRQGLFTVAVSTDGAAPAVAARVRRRLMKELSVVDLGRVRLSDTLRRHLKRTPLRTAVLRWVATFASSSKGIP